MNGVRFGGLSKAEERFRGEACITEVSTGSYTSRMPRRRLVKNDRGDVGCTSTAHVTPSARTPSCDVAVPWGRCYRDLPLYRLGE